MAQIYEQLSKVAAELGVIEKDTVNAGRQSYKAFGVDTIYRHLRPLFAKHGVVVVPQIDSVTYGEITASSGSQGVSAHVIGTWLFYAADGSSVEMRFAAEGHDYQDKATNKAVQQAFKYGLIQMFQISTGEMDADAAPLPERAPVKADPLLVLKNTAMEHCEGDKARAKVLFEAVMAEYGYAPDEFPPDVEIPRMVDWMKLQ